MSNTKYSTPLVSLLLITQTNCVAVSVLSLLPLHYAICSLQSLDSVQVCSNESMRYNALWLFA